MKIHKKYRIIIEDESRLECLAEHSFTPAALTLWGLALLGVCLVVAFLIISITPIRTLIPGFIPDSRRAASEEALLRVDSLREAYLINEKYLNNLKNVMNSDRKVGDTLAMLPDNTEIAVESILPQSREESGLAAVMQEREKFNVSLLSKMAAEGMLLFPVSDEGIVPDDSRDSYQVRMLVPANSTIMAVADGAVIAEYFDSRSQRNVVILQHDNGFVSSIAGLGNMLVGSNDIVNGGEVISYAPHIKNRSASEIFVELWHNGLPVKPYDYIIGRKYDSRADQQFSNM
ncbi:MAG: M23 family metallopeptidase [Muribaculaceae bacterium]|nr:M23 family metallopeptidase [Muribaculaceae bacterium]